MSENTLGKTELDDLVSQLNKLRKHQYLQVIEAAAKNRKGAKPRQLIAEIVNDDIQQNLIENGYELTCPECGSGSYVKNGTRNGFQRFKCRECGNQFGYTSGTFLSKSNYMWNVWTKLVFDVINSHGIDHTLKNLHDDYGCKRIHRETVWQMKMKIMYAIWTLPSPKLRGTIQMDDTFFREAQKGADELVNPLPKSANVERKPRYGSQPSLLGTLGPEFASVTCAVDNTGHCVVRSLSMGVPTSRQIEEFIDEHMEDIAFLCSDDDKTYRKAIRSLSLPHYIHPSTMLSVTREAGVVQHSKDPEKAAIEAENNRRIKERLWKNGELDFIEGVEARTYRQRCQLIETYGLSMSRVNGLHNRLEKFINGRRHGVNTKYLPLYLAFFQYLENRREDGKGCESMKDAAEILSEAVATRAVFDGEIAEEWAAGKYAPGMASGVFVAKLMDETSLVRIVTGNRNFKFNKTDGFRYVSPRDLLLSIPLPIVKQMATENKIKIGNRSKSALVRDLLELENLDELIAKYAYFNAENRLDDEDKELETAAFYARIPFNEVNENRMVLSQTMPAMMFAHADEVEHPAVFITVKTTGKNYETDEVIGFYAVDANGEPLMEKKFRPTSKEMWYEKANNPSYTRPSDVLDQEDVGTVEEAADEIEKILTDAKSVIGWNLHFQLDMLHACHVDVPAHHKFIDLSKELYEDARKQNKNRRNSFDDKAQDKFRKATYDYLGEYYEAEKPIDDVGYLIRIWNATYGLEEAYDDMPF